MILSSSARSTSEKRNVIGPDEFSNERFRFLRSSSFLSGRRFAPGCRALFLSPLPPFFRVFSPKSFPVAQELRRVGVGHRWRITDGADAAELQGPWSAPELRPRLSSCLPVFLFFPEDNAPGRRVYSEESGGRCRSLLRSAIRLELLYGNVVQRREKRGQRGDVLFGDLHDRQCLIPVAQDS